MKISNAEKGESQLPDPGKGFADACLESPAHDQVLSLTHLSSFPPSVRSCIYLKVLRACKTPGSRETRVNNHGPCLQMVKACPLVKLHSGERRWRVSLLLCLGLVSATLGMFLLLLYQGNI